LEEEIRQVQNMQTCPLCGATCGYDSLFCPQCGDAFPREAAPAASGIRFCSNCGAPLMAGAAFCTDCGQALLPAAPVMPPAPSPAFAAPAFAAPAFATPLTADSDASVLDATILGAPASGAARYCSGCGALLIEDTVFCVECGQPAEATTEAPNPEACPEEASEDTLAGGQNKLNLAKDNMDTENKIRLAKDNVDENPDPESSPTILGDGNYDYAGTVVAEQAAGPPTPGQTADQPVPEQEKDAFCFCMNCGAALTDDAAFCIECGAGVGESTEGASREEIVP
jgi:predicted amidophosphoribosyltransferase